MVPTSRSDSEQTKQSPKLLATQEAGSGSDSENQCTFFVYMVVMMAMMAAMMVVMRGALQSDGDRVIA